MIRLRFYDAWRNAGASVPDPACSEADVIEVDRVPFLVPGGSEERDDALIGKLIRNQRLALDIARLGILGAWCRPGDIAIDVGANVGMTVIPPLLTGYVDKVYAIEPSARNVRCLKTNIANLGLEKAAPVARCAVGAVDGVARLRLISSSQHQLSVDDDGARTEDVVIVTLNTFIRANMIDVERIAVVKSDTQGFEPDVLAGAGDILEKRRALWIVEYWPAGVLTERRNLEGMLTLMSEYFSFFIDMKRGSNTLFPITELRALLAEYDAGLRHTDLILIP